MEKLCSNPRCMDGRVPVNEGEGTAPCGECEIARLQKRIEKLEGELNYIAEVAHQHSTGPEKPDVLWDIRNVAYKALEDG